MTKSKILSKSLPFGALLWTLLGFTAQAPAQIEIVKDFAQLGRLPNALMQANDGFLYGTTSAGGAFNGGTLFRTDTSGNVTTLHTFECDVATNGCSPGSRLVQASDGFLYGTTQRGGVNDGGTVFKIRPDGTGFSVIHLFQCEVATNGCIALGGLIELADGFLYGTTSSGGTNSEGTIFKLRPDGTGFSLIHSFQCGVATNGCVPWPGLIQASDGLLYGTTESGGANNGGTVFKVMADGTNFSVIKSFQCVVATNGCSPLAGVIQASDGLLYGTTASGGANDGGTNQGGTVFKLGLDGTGFSLIHSFQCGVATNGCGPWSGLIQLADGFLYGTTIDGGANNDGTVFKLRPDGTSFSVIKSFQCYVAVNGCRSSTGLIQLADGFLYGTTTRGGANNEGTVFKIMPDGTSFSVVSSAFGCLAANGCFPFSGLIPLADGFLYGTTVIGGASGEGTLFRILPDGTGYSIVKSFRCSGTDGCQPENVVPLADGFLYGTTSLGGANDSGTAFKIRPDGTGFSVIHTFECNVATNGCFAFGKLVQLADGFLYGTTANGGANFEGNVFRLRPDGTGFSVIHTFECGVATNGCFAFGKLVQLADGFLYGTTAEGGANGGGTVFRILPDGTSFSIIKAFDCNVASDGCFPGEMIQLADGFLYGTTGRGGANSGGTVFKIRPDGTGFSVIHAFQCGVAANGCFPSFGLIQLADGFLYGTTDSGGANNVGTVFKIRPDGTSFGVIDSFANDGDDGRNPNGALILATNGFLYGTTLNGGQFGGGTIFRLPGPDLIAPDTNITAQPPDPSSSSSATFQFNSTEAGSTFECKLDSGSFVVCVSPQIYNGLANGSHTFQVRARDLAGNADPTPATYVWNVGVDIIPPVVASIVRAASNPTNASTVTWTVTFSENVAGVDASDFALAATGVAGAIITNVGGANNVYTVTANTGTGSGTLGLNLVDDDTIRDSSNNPLDGTGAGNGNFIGEVYSIDITMPDTNITAQPSNPTTSNSASFQFSSTEPNSTFECKIDSGNFSSCASPQTYTGLGLGNHTFEVRAIDALGNVDATPAGYSWTIDAAPTVLSIIRAISSPTSAATVAWTVTFSENVTGVNASDFTLVASGLSNASITNVSGASNIYTVTANTGSGNGTLGLNLVDNDSIRDGANNPLSGVGSGNGNFTGEVYTIDKTVFLVDTGPGSNNTLGAHALFAAGSTTCSPQPSCAGQFQYLGGEFSLTEAVTITKIEGWMAPRTGGRVAVHIRVRDASGLPSTILSPPNLGPRSIYSKIYDVPGGGGPSWVTFDDFEAVLAAGTYWVIFQPVAGSSFSTSMPGGAPKPLARYAFFTEGNNRWINDNSLNIGIRIAGTKFPGAGFGTAARAITTGDTGVFCCPHTLDSLQGTGSFDPAGLQQNTSTTAIAWLMGYGLAQGRGKLVENDLNVTASASMSLRFRGTSRGVAFRTFTNMGDVSKTFRVNAVLSGSFGVTGGYAEAHIYALDPVGFANRVTNSGVGVAEYLLRADTVSSAVPFSTLFGASMLTNHSVIPNYPAGQRGTSLLSTGFITLAPNESVTVLFELLTRAGPEQNVFFNNTLSGAQNLFTDTNGDPVPEIVGLGPAEPLSPPVSSIALAPTTATATVGGLQNITATVTAADGTPVTNAPIVFSVTSGPNAGLTSTDLPIATHENGQAVFTYSSNFVGADTVQANIGTVSSNIAQAIWEAPVNGPTIMRSPTSLNQGATVTGTWSGIANPTPRDWIGLYSTGGTQYLWLYVSCTQTAGVSRVSGSCGLQIPANAPSGSYELRLYANDGYTLLARSEPINIGGPAPVLPLVGIQATTNAAEPSNNGQFTISRTGDASNALTVNFTVGGTATPGNNGTPGSDYQSLGNSVVLPANVNSVVIPVNINDDTVFEGSETIIVSLTSGTNYAVGSPSSAIVTIADNEPSPPGPVITVAPNTVARGSQVVVNWSGITVPTARDWIGLYSTTGTQYLWLYVSCTQSAGAPRAAGSCTLTVPGATPPGNFEVRLYANDGYTVLATSGSITVQ